MLHNDRTQTHTAKLYNEEVSIDNILIKFQACIAVYWEAVYREAAHCEAVYSKTCVASFACATALSLSLLTMAADSHKHCKRPLSRLTSHVTVSDANASDTVKLG